MVPIVSDISAEKPLTVKGHGYNVMDLTSTHLLCSHLLLGFYDKLPPKKTKPKKLFLATMMKISYFGSSVLLPLSFKRQPWNNI